MRMIDMLGSRYNGHALARRYQCLLSDIPHRLPQTVTRLRDKFGWVGSGKAAEMQFFFVLVKLFPRFDNYTTRAANPTPALGSEKITTVPTSIGRKVALASIL